MRQIRRPALLAFGALAALWLVACSDTSTSLGRYYQGRILQLAVMEIKRAPEVRYATIDSEEVIRHYRLIPAEEDLELVLVRLIVRNDTATSAVFTVDRQGAELLDFFQGTYQPVDVANRAILEEEESDKPAVDEQSLLFIRGPYELMQGNSIDGWMVFEAPEGTQFQTIKWRAGDSVTIDF